MGGISQPAPTIMPWDVPTATPTPSFIPTTQRWEPITYTDNSAIIEICEGKEKGIYPSLDSVCTEAD